MDDVERLRELVQRLQNEARESWAHRDIFNEAAAALTARGQEVAQLREELRTFVIEETGSDYDSGCISYKCACCQFEWVDTPERHDDGCLAALQSGERPEQQNTGEVANVTGNPS